MTLQQVTIEIPEKVLQAEKTDAESFGFSTGQNNLNSNLSLVLVIPGTARQGRCSSRVAGRNLAHM
jgi:hypothetical protein